MDTTLSQAPAPGPAWRGVLRPLITAGGYRAASPAAGFGQDLEGMAALSRAFARWDAR